MTDFEEFVAQAERAWGRKIASEAGRIWRTDAQRVRMPTLRSYVGERNQFGDVWMGPRECLNRDLDLVDVQVGHGFIP